MISGIYEIRNIKTGDCYIGSAKNLIQRKNRHFKDLRNGNHHSIILQRAYNKYGKEFFRINLLEQVRDVTKLIEREQFYLNEIKPKYNIFKIAGSALGVVKSKETKEKHRQYALENNIKPPESTWKNKQKAVIQLHYDTLEEIQEFISLSEACRSVGKNHTYASTIAAVCNGKRNSAFKFKWKWKE